MRYALSRTCSRNSLQSLRRIAPGHYESLDQNAKIMSAIGFTRRLSGGIVYLRLAVLILLWAANWSLSKSVRQRTGTKLRIGVTVPPLHLFRLRFEPDPMPDRR